MVTAGIDLGTTNSVIAVKVGGIIRALPVASWNVRNINLLPSLVDVTSSGLVIDKGGFRGDVIRSIKRRMGSADKVFGYSAAEVSSVILGYLKGAAEGILGVGIDEVVVTVPAYFDNIERLSTKLAASLAGVKVLRLLNEPTAAALAYGLGGVTSETVAIYDLGGGTFDFSVLKICGDIFQVLATGGDTHLGGDDIDLDIAVYCCMRYGVDFYGLSDSDHCKCLLAARELKEGVSSCIYLVLGDYSLEFYITSSELEGIVFDRLGITIGICERALMDAGLSISDLDHLVLVGGMTKLSAVKLFIRENFGCDILDTLDADETVAIGAACYGEGLVRKDSLLLDVTPLSLGIETFGGGVDRIIMRNSPIPYEVTYEYTTVESGQSKMVINIVQGEGEVVSDCRSLGRFILDGLTIGPAGAVRVGINFRIDVNGLLEVRAWEVGSSRVLGIRVEPTSGLTEEDFFRMLSVGAERRV